MAIKLKYNTRNIFLISTLFLLFSFPIIQIIGIETPEIRGEQNNQKPYDQSSSLNLQGTPNVENETILPDKVYTFLAPDDTLTFYNVSLERYYDHYFHVELVSPHNCSMEIQVIDPKDRTFVIFNETLDSEDNWAKQFSIPFGTALSGNHTIHFIVHSEDNLNLYIRMEKTWKCLYDKIGSDDAESLVFYTVNPCENNTKFSHNINLNTDMMYNFYIGRVSAISITLNNSVVINTQILDPDETTFTIHKEKEIPGVSDVEKFEFGTAKNGTYIFNMTVFCEVEYINLAYCITEEYQISEGVEGNQTTPEQDPPPSGDNSTDENPDDDIPDDDGGDNNETEGGSNPNNSTGNNTLPLRVASIPQEWMFGSVIFFGGLMTFAIVIIVYHKKKSAVKLNI